MASRMKRYTMRASTSARKTPVSIPRSSTSTQIRSVSSAALRRKANRGYWMRRLYSLSMTATAERWASTASKPVRTSARKTPTGSSPLATARYRATMSSRKPRRRSSTIDSLESKWWYRLPERMPAASAISRTVVVAKPCSANRPAAMARIAPRRAETTGTTASELIEANLARAWSRLLYWPHAQRPEGLRRRCSCDLSPRPLAPVPRQAIRGSGGPSQPGRSRPLQPGHGRRPLEPAPDLRLRPVPAGDQLDSRGHDRQVRRGDRHQGVHRRPGGEGDRGRGCRRDGDLWARVRHVARRHRSRAPGGDGAGLQPLGRGDARDIRRQGADLGPRAAQRRGPRRRGGPVRVRRAGHPLLLGPPPPLQPPQPRRPVLRPDLRARPGSGLRVRDPRVHGPQRGDGGLGSVRALPRVAHGRPSPP